ncbi:MAG: calmodulin-binding protein [Pirellulales bacterium]|nr:calmodulin-binding protein [Pirellulales bacterium]
MLRRCLILVALTAAAWAFAGPSECSAQQAFGRQWAHTYNSQDWDRFYHYPYVYYPQNYYSKEYYKSSESLYFRYPPEMRVPVYNRQWHNMFPEGATWNRYIHTYHGPPGGGKYHSGHHFILDQF